MRIIRQATVAVSVALLQLCCAPFGFAQTTYDISAFPFTYSDAESVYGTLQTSASGTFSSAAAIAAIFNSSAYVATLYGPMGVISSIDNLNSAWHIELSEPGASVQLTIDDTQISLSFSTPTEFSEGVLLARSDDMRTIFQFAQSNNVSDVNFADYDYDAINSAYSPMPYGATFVFPAIPEPSAALLLTLSAPLFLRRSQVRPRNPK